MLKPNGHFFRLATSKFRSRFKLDPVDRQYLKRIGQERLRSHAVDFIRKRLAPAAPAKDGKQTPFRGHPVFKAQHATATCCRGCLAKWHRIPKGRKLTEAEIQAVAGVILEWIRRQAATGDPLSPEAVDPPRPCD